MNFIRIKNKLKKYSICEFFLLSEYIIVSIMFIMSALKADKYTSIPHAAVYAILFAMFAYKFVREIFILKKTDAVSVMLISATLLMLTSVAVGLIKNGLYAFSGSYLSKFIFCFGTMSLFYVVKDEKIQRSTAKTMIGITLFVSVFYAILLVTRGNDNFYMYNSTWKRNLLSDYLTFNLGNPNKAALLLTFLFLHSILGVSFFEMKTMKICSSLIAMLIFIMIFLTKSRNVIFIFGVFMLATLVILLFKRRKIKNKVWGFAVLLPILFVVLYLLIVDIPIVGRVLSVISSAEKKISSREVIWQRTLEVFDQSPFFGNYYGLIEEDILNSHNSMIFILSNFGCVGFVGFAMYVYSVFVKFNSVCNNKTQNIVLVAFAAAFLTGFAEAAVFSGSSGMFIFFGGLLAFISAGENIVLDSERTVLEIVKQEK